jgi:hypothetical protein
MPWDVQAYNDEAGALKRLANTQTGLDTNWLLQEQRYGTQGPWADAKTNPYSEAALLQRSYENGQRGSKNSYAAQGHLYSGALVNARNSNTHAFDLGRNQLEGDRALAFAKYQSERTGAEDDYRNAVSEAGWNRVNAGVEQEPEPEAAPAGGGGGGKKKGPRNNKIKQNIARGKALR